MSPQMCHLPLRHHHTHHHSHPLESLVTIYDKLLSYTAIKYIILYVHYTYAAPALIRLLRSSYKSTCCVTRE